MPLSIGNNRIIPAPMVTISKQGSFAQDGSPLNTNYTVTLEGTILPNLGSPSSSGWYTDPTGYPGSETSSINSDDLKFNSILTKQAYLKNALAATGVQIQYSPPGSGAVSFYGKLVNLSFTPGSWVIKSDYTAQFETTKISQSGFSGDDTTLYDTSYIGLNLTSVSDNYTFKEKDDGSNIIEATRTISATSAYKAATGTIKPWQNAQTWVWNRRDQYPFSNTVLGTGVQPDWIQYNVFEDETVDEMGGNYTLSQRFILALSNYNDYRTIQRVRTPNKLGDGGPFIETITVNGLITGYDAANVSATKYSNASGYWATASGAIQASVGAYGDPLSVTVNENHQLGTIEYNFQFINNSGIWYKHTYDVATTYSQNDNPVVTINGTIEGYTPSDLYYGAGVGYDKFANAYSGWNVLSPTLKTLAFSYPTINTSGLLFSDNPISRNISYNRPNGTITYSYGFAYTSGASTNYQNNYTIDLSTDNAPGNVNIAGLLCKATINGQVIGLASGNDPNTKYSNASAGWSAINGNLYNLVNGQFSLIGSGTPALNSGFVSRTVAIDTKGGTISYTAAFANTPPTASGIVAVQDVSVEDVNPQDVFAVQIIPGLASGPIIQNIATVTEHRRSINIALTLFAKPTAPYYWSYTDRTTPQTVASGILSGLVPTGIRSSNYWFASDTENWNYKGGLYTKNVTVIY